MPHSCRQVCISHNNVSFACCTCTVAMDQTFGAVEEFAYRCWQSWPDVATHPTATWWPPPIKTASTCVRLHVRTSQQHEARVLTSTKLIVGMCHTWGAACAKPMRGSNASRLSCHLASSCPQYISSQWLFPDGQQLDGQQFQRSVMMHGSEDIDDHKPTSRFVSYCRSMGGAAGSVHIFKPRSLHRHPHASSCMTSSAGCCSAMEEAAVMLVILDVFATLHLQTAATRAICPACVASSQAAAKAEHPACQLLVMRRRA